MKETYYLKATGDNRYAGGSYRWLKIRGFKALKNSITGKESYELEVKTQWGIKYMMISDYDPLYVKFKDHQDKPVSFVRVINYFKDRGIGLLIK